MDLEERVQLALERNRKTYSCRNGCDKEFASRKSRRNHENYHCPRSTVPVEALFCPYCKAILGSPKSLKCHIETCKVRREREQWLAGYYHHPQPLPHSPTFMFRGGWLAAQIPLERLPEEERAWLQPIPHT